MANLGHYIIYGPFYISFYDDESTFIHGGGLHSSADLGVVRGRHEIQKRIMALNFDDCRSKIDFIDAQESANKSIVIQVLGQLSNRVGKF